MEALDALLVVYAPETVSGILSWVVVSFPRRAPANTGARATRTGTEFDAAAMSGQWSCGNEPCTGQCSAWGFGHFTTFDGTTLDFLGDCEYVFSRGQFRKQFFEVAIQNVPCEGEDAVTCFLAVSLTVGNGNSSESLMLPRDKRPLATHLMKSSSWGLFRVFSIPEFGLKLHWDLGTRLYLFLDPKWSDAVTGLCGNFNGKTSDDFLPPSSQLPENDAATFADSWKTQSQCKPALSSEWVKASGPGRKLVLGVD
ncbi:unnamed protein product [Cyprideis torosa]|uniref:Uncharacterized protein n=1 Tax=Cyprideis torosa TaxID=163714 RepID=A0A7R8WKP6_9CRUS|nr:unnamed protein product [Cyprideis torosa]CAG0903423.1 unnamed protein product [Cyprideis torosa]